MPPRASNLVYPSTYLPLSDTKSSKLSLEVFGKIIGGNPNGNQSDFEIKTLERVTCPRMVLGNDETDELMTME